MSCFSHYVVSIKKKKKVNIFLKYLNVFQIIATYTEAVQTVDPKQAVGKLHTLWVNFAKFYEQNNQIEDARLIFEKATQVSYTKVDDLASVWCEWAEMEIRHE